MYKQRASLRVKWQRETASAEAGSDLDVQRQGTRMKKKILIIEDNPVVRQTLVRVLEDEGYQTVTAQDGMRGVSLYATEQPDLVITDIIMPEKEGIETIRSVLHQNPNAMIIAISGGGRIGSADFLRMARRIGATETLAKPFDPDILREMANRLLAAA